MKALKYFGTALFLSLSFTSLASEVSPNRSSLTPGFKFNYYLDKYQKQSEEQETRVKNVCTGANSSLFDSLKSFFLENSITPDNILPVARKKKSQPQSRIADPQLERSFEQLKQSMHANHNAYYTLAANHIAGRFLTKLQLMTIIDAIKRESKDDQYIDCFRAFSNYYAGYLDFKDQKVTDNDKFSFVVFSKLYDEVRTSLGNQQGASNDQPGQSSQRVAPAGIDRNK